MTSFTVCDDSPMIGPRIGAIGLICLLTILLVSACDGESQPMTTHSPTDNPAPVSTPTPSAQTLTPTNTATHTAAPASTPGPTSTSAPTLTPAPVPMSLAEYAALACRDPLEDWEGGFISSWEEFIEFLRWRRAEALSVEPPPEISEYHRLSIAFLDEYIRYIEEHASDSPFEIAQDVLAGMETGPAFQEGRRLLDEIDAISFSPETQAEIEAHGWFGDACAGEAR